MTVFAGVGGGFALWLAFRRQQATELASRREHRQRQREADDARRDATERRITELRIEAVAQLGSDKAAVRIGGLHNLERLGEEYPRLRQIILNELCAYLRMPFVMPAEDGSDNAYARVEREVRLTAQRIIERHVRLDDPHRWEHGGVNFAGAVLERVDFRGADLGHANFSRATFYGDLLMRQAHFTSAKFNGAVFHGAVHLRGAKVLGGAWFNNATVHGAFLARGAVFQGTTRFRETYFTASVSFRGATFGSSAMFSHVTFEGDVNLNSVRFLGPLDLYRTRFLSIVQCDRMDARSDARFGRTEFRGATRLQGATFRMVARFENSVFPSDTRFHNVRFYGHAVFAGTTFLDQAEFDGSYFHHSADFSTTHFAHADAFAGHRRCDDIYAALAYAHHWPAGWRVVDNSNRVGYGRLERTPA
ncbi:pentapeptide repeat-containing protein [Stackebrandtia sp.]|uniref:pentapeptide repeat-containing protein n=1 Tax=Stackebrandtia sp. TaxID=2023065 RepID=UPI002D79AB79|nr:pentapeptide repeat-containing protein [Stackebrandtia sp.]